MTFVHPLLLGGLLLVGVPVLIHLIMQQKPKHLKFPAFRFLVQKVRTNQRSLRLRHLLLLLLRMALIALLCVALARPKLFNERITFMLGQPVAAAIVVDTSMSMEYKLGDRTRLDDAKRRALELLDDLPENSRIAIFDTGDAGSGDWLATSALARERISSLQLRPGNGPVTEQVGQAYRLFESLDDDPDQRNDPMPRFLYVFSDRTEASWDVVRVAKLAETRDAKKSKVVSLFIDVGVDKPTDLAITDLQLERQIVSINGKLVVHATVRATGEQDYDTFISCRVDDEKTAGDRKQIKGKGPFPAFHFERGGLALGQHQLEVSLGNPDSLPFNNVRYATFEVRGARKVLTVSDNPRDAYFWQVALQVGERFGEAAFDCEVKSTQEANEFSAADLAGYEAICLLNVAAPSEELWAKLLEYVQNKEGGLAILPGGDELSTGFYKSPGALKLMPGELKGVIRSKADIPWNGESHQPPVKDWFDEWKKDPKNAIIRTPPTVLRYWDVDKFADGTVLAAYADAKTHPAVLEKKLDRAKFRGRVLLFTTTFDGRKLDRTSDRQWNDYLPMFFLALAKKSVSYLTRDTEEGHFNYTCGQPVLLTLPAAPRFPHYTLIGPGLTGQAGHVPGPQEKQNDLLLSLAQTGQPGSYTLKGANEAWKTSFSMNVASSESNLERVPTAKIEELFGPNSVLTLKPDESFKHAREGHWNQPVELIAWLMILVLLVLAVENLLANKFYRQPTAAEQSPGN